MVSHIRWEDDGLSDHLALGVHGDTDGVSTAAWCTSDKGILVGRGPAAMADI